MTHTTTAMDIGSTTETEAAVNGARPIPADLVTAIDVGTTKVCTIIGRKDGPKDIHIVAHSTVPCDGIRKGNVSDVVATRKAIRDSVRQVEKATGYHIASAFVGVTGSHITFENWRDALELDTYSTAITGDDLNWDPKPFSTSSDEPGRKLIHAIRMSYSLDGEEGIRNPVGMHTKRLEVDTHVVTGTTTLIDKLTRAVEDAGIRITSLVLEPLASGLAVMTAEERERGAVLVDVGGGTTDVVRFSKGRVCYTGVIPVGGFQFTNDIAATFNTSYQAAEEVKLRYASAEFQPPSSGDEITLPVVGRDVGLKVQPGEICELTRERAHELARLIKIKLDDANEGESVASRIVLTGGTSNLPGLARLMQQSLSIPVRMGVPEIRSALPDELKDPIYATGVGILLWALNDYVPPKKGLHFGSNGNISAGRRGFVSSLFRLVGKLMPRALFAARKGRI